MPTTVQVQTNFTTGEISPKTLGRSDLKRFLGALAECENMILPKQGGAERRTGTRFVAEVKDSADLTILYPFRSSAVANYIIEFGDLYARFYVDRGVLLQTDGMTPVEIITPWLTSELRDLKFTQSADVLFVFHPNHETRRIQRTSATSFQIRFLNAQNGPYQPRNTTGTFLTTTVLTGSGFITSDDGAGNFQVIGINDGRGFLQTDVNRQIRWIESSSSKQTWFTITSIPVEKVITNITQANPAQVTTSTVHGLTTGQNVYINEVVGMTEVNDTAFNITVIDTTNYTIGVDSSAFTAYISDGVAHRSDRVGIDIEGPDITSAPEQDRKSWALGSWSDTSGWPRTGTFHQQRLWLGGTDEETQTVWGSVTGVFNDFSPTSDDGNDNFIVSDDNAVTFTVDANLVMNIYDMKSHARGLIIMTDEAEVVASTTDGSFTPMTPSNKGARIQSTHGIDRQVRAIVVDNTILFAQASGRKVRGMQFRFEDDQFQADDLTKLAENIGGDGFVDITYQEEPDEILWLVRTDGQLIGLTYDPQEQVFAWHRHIIGGNFLGTDTVVESCAAIRDDPGDLLWLIVKRTVDGSQVRHVEFVGDRFDNTDNAEEAFFVDSGLSSLDLPELITAATKTNPLHITATVTGFAAFGNGTSIKILSVEGMTELNGGTFTITNGSTSTVNGELVHDFDLSGIDGTTGFSTYTKGGNVRAILTVVSGLDHLEGETVNVAGDGLELDDEVVSSGSITLSTASSIVYVGLPSPYKLVTVPITPAAAGFDTRTSLMRAAKANIMLNRSQSGSLGVFGGASFPIEYVDTNLFTGIKEVGIEAEHAFRFQIELSSDGIFPMNVLQLGLEMDIGS